MRSLEFCVAAMKVFSLYEDVVRAFGTASHFLFSCRLSERIVGEEPLNDIESALQAIWFSKGHTLQWVPPYYTD